ncbi:hypothetical protein TI39_contig86g00006 [Zymoseptoria brevis]|uniref:Uncharacterized protein n=1 Tax=Zymoseptoria brevis TaxID=1047168 RepID=A0A0F4GXP3_9PEZI|nr:hypothetical protein TI39_contig86g00006 [Zymoseptoria brevis]
MSSQEALAMREHECELFNIPQELQDQIFDDVIDDAEIVFCRPQGSAISTSKILIVGPQFHANYRSALWRRGDKFLNHRVSVDFQLCGKASTTPLAPVEISLPSCATGLHIFIQVTKSGILTGKTSSTDIAGLHDISNPLKTLIDTINVEHLLVELQVIDPTIGTTSKSPKQRKIRDAYRHLHGNLDDLNWRGLTKANSKLIVAALVTHNREGTAVFALPNRTQTGPFDPGCWTTGAFNGNGLTAHVAPLAEIFCARARIEKATDTKRAQPIHDDRAARASARRRMWTPFDWS